MQIGAKKINVKPNQTVTFDSDSRLVCYGLHNGNRSEILGSGTKFKCQSKDFKKIEVWTLDTAFWTCSQKDNYRGNPVDPTPMELHVEDKPPSLRDEMREYIREILSTQALDDGQESLEESMDFDIPDEFDPTSPYELTEMQPEYPNIITEAPPEPLGETLDESNTNTAQEVKDAVSESTEAPTPP